MGTGELGKTHLAAHINRNRRQDSPGPGLLTPLIHPIRILSVAILTAGKSVDVELPLPLKDDDHGL